MTFEEAVQQAASDILKMLMDAMADPEGGVGIDQVTALIDGHIRPTLADREERIRVLDRIVNQQNKERVKIIAEGLKNDEQQFERIRERDGEWVDAIEDTLHFGIIPETLAGTIECMKAWLEEREARIERVKGLAAEMQNAGKSRRCMHVWEAGDVIALSDVEDWADELLAALDGEPKKGGVDG
jgi:hypothetical protein